VEYRNSRAAGSNFFPLQDAARLRLDLSDNKYLDVPFPPYFASFSLCFPFRPIKETNPAARKMNLF